MPLETPLHVFVGCAQYIGRKTVSDAAADQFDVSGHVVVVVSRGDLG